MDSQAVSMKSVAFRSRLKTDLSVSFMVNTENIQKTVKGNNIRKSIKETIVRLGKYKNQIPDFLPTSSVLSYKI